VKSIDYDVDLDFLLPSPKTTTNPVDSESDDSVSLQQNGSLQQSVTTPSNSDLDCLITPDRPKLTPVAAAADRPAKVPSVDRSTKPSSVSTMPGSTRSSLTSAVLSNTVSGAAVNGSEPATDVDNKPTSDPKIDPPNNAPDTRTARSHRGAVDVTPRSSVPPAPDRSTKPAASSTLDASVHSAQWDKERAELSRLTSKKMQEASEVANLMREKRRLEMEMERTRQQMQPGDTDTRSVTSSGDCHLSTACVSPTHTHTSVLRPFVRDHPGQPVPEENFWTLWCKGRLTEADTPITQLGATPSRLSSAHLHYPPIFCTGRMPFLPANCQLLFSQEYCSLCFDAVDSATGRASGHLTCVDRICNRRMKVFSCYIEF